MCAVIFPFIRRLFSSFVLTCFLCTTLFQTIAFAEFERVIPEHASLEREAGALKTIRLNIGIQSFDSAADATHPDPLSDGKQLDIYADMLQQTTDLFIPFEESLDKTQESLDHIYKGSIYEGIKISEDGIKWTAHGYNYHMHNSGHMSVSANTAGLELSRNLKLSNPHGAIFLEGNLDFDTLSLDTKDVVQHGNLKARSLTTKVAGKLINSGFMSVSELLFDDIGYAERNAAPLQLFVNTREGHFEGQDLSITGACMIQNDGQFTTHGKTSFSFHGRVENNGTMTLDDASIQDGILINTGILKSTAGMEGTFKALLNTGTVDAKGGFNDVVVQAFVNGESGVIRGSGHLTVGGSDQIAVNRGNITSPVLALTTRGSFTNEGNGAITVRHLSSEGQLFRNEGDVHVKTWDHHARNVHNADGAEFVIDEAATMDSEAIDNQGTLIFNGTLNGRIGHVTNTGGFITKGKTALTGIQFSNTGKLRLSDDFKYQGKTFLTTDTSYFYAIKPIELIITDPLVLRGRIDLEQGSTFTAPTIDNHAKVRSETGKTTFDGELTNHNKIDVDELGYEGKRLVNRKASVIEANYHRRTKHLDKGSKVHSWLALLQNDGDMTLRKGGFSIATVKNQGNLSLLDGDYTVLTRWDNLDGIAHIDQLYIAPNNLTLEGKLDVTHFKGTYGSYKTMFIKGPTTIRSGKFETESLTNEHNLILGKGKYEIGKLKINEGRKLVLLDQAHVIIAADIDNVGDIHSLHNLAIKFKRSLSSDATAQVSPITAAATLNVTTNSVDKASATHVSQPTITSIDQLRKSNVDTKRQATDEEKKHFLQIVMEHQITTHIENQRIGKKPTIFLSQFPTYPKGDALFGHFEVLRLAEKMAHELVEYIGEYDYESINEALSPVSEDFVAFYGHCKVRFDTFSSWFKEVFNKNKAKFPLASNSLLKNDALEGSSLTIVYDSNYATPLSKISQLGMIKTKKNFILTLPGRNVAPFLQQYHSNFHAAGKLLIYGKSFIPAADLKLGQHIEMHVDDYKNDCYFAAFSALDLFAKTFRNGKSNDEMGSLKTLEPEHIEGQRRPPVPAHKYHMNVTVEGDVDNRYGYVHSCGKTNIISSKGNIKWGDSVLIPKNTKKYRHFSYNTGPQFCSYGPGTEDHIYGDRTGNVWKNVDGYESNRSGFSSNDVLTILSKTGDILGNYGSLYSGSSLYLILEKTGQQIHLRSTQINLSGSIYFKGSTLKYDRYLPSSFKFGHSGGWYGMWNEINISPIAYLQCIGDVHFDVDDVSIAGNNLNVLGSVFKNHHSMTTEAEITTRLTIKPGECRGGGTCNGQSHEGIHHEVSHTFGGQIFIGKDFLTDLQKELINHGFLSARTIDAATNILNLGGGNTQRGPSHMSGFLLPNGILTTAASYKTQLIGGIANETDEGFVVPREKISNRHAIVKPKDALILGQSERGFKPGVPFYIHPAFERFAFMNMHGGATGRMYDPYTADHRGDLANVLVRRTQNFFPHQDTITLSDLDNVTKSILLWQLIPEQWILDKRIRPHYLMREYIPYTEILKNIGPGFYGQNVTLNANETYIDEGVIVQEAPLEDITDPEEEHILTARAARDDDPDKDVDLSAPKTKVRKPKAKKEAGSATLNFGSLDARGAKFISDGRLNLTNEKGGFLGSKTKRMSIDGGFQDVIERFSMRSKGPITVKAQHDLYLQAIEAHSDTSILFETTGNIFDIPLMLEGARTTVEHNRRSTKIIEEHWSHAATSNYTCKGAVVFKADGRIDTYATKVRAKLLQLLAGEGVRIHDVQNSYSCATKEHTKGKSSCGGLFGGKDSEIYSSCQRINSVGMDAGDTPVEIILGQRGSVDITGANIKDLVIDPKGGTITFHLSKSYESFQRSEKSEGMWYKSQSMHMSEHQTGTQSRIGNLKVITTKDAPVTLLIEEVRGRTAEFLKRIEMDHGQVTQLFWDEVHNEVNQKAGGITAACGALIAIAVGAVTFGTGAAASVGGSMATTFGFAAEGIASTAFAAGFTSVCTSAALSLANNGFDPQKSAKAFASTETLQSVGMSMLLAGMTHGILEHFELATDVSTLTTLEGQAANQGVNMAVKMSTDLAFTRRTDGVAATLGAVAGTIGGYVSTKIGTWYKGSEGAAVDAISHKLLHALKGAGEGIIVGSAKGMNADMLGKAVAGAAGALIAETTADIFTPTGGIGDKGYDRTRIRQTQAAARIVTGAIAFAVGMSADDIGMAIFSANTSLDHNFGASAANHIGVKTDTKDEIVDESALKSDAEANGISPEEQALVRTKLQHLSNESLGKTPTAAELITEMPSSPEALEATQKSVIKGYVQKIAGANENIHQILREHPWAEKTLTSSVHLFGDCVRAMLYIDMAVLGAAGGTGLCAASGIKNIAGLRTCALLGGATSLAATALMVEPSIEALLTEGVRQLGNISADHLGDTAQEKAAIRQLIGDGANLAGLLAGANYLKVRGANLPTFGGVAGGVLEAEVGIANREGLLWESWTNYPKTSIGETQYAQIGNRLYTQHAVDRMQPSGLGAPAGSIGAGRSFPPSLIEEVIMSGSKTTVSFNGVERVVHSLGTAEVVTEFNSKIVVTVNPFRGK
ncbi:MAG: hypothetical protein V4544_06240 [Pseudomonadota bacterium]